MTVEEARKHIQTDIADEGLADRLSALESAIRKYTNNNFQDKNRRRDSDIVGGMFIVEALTPFEVGDTVEVSCSKLNKGLFTVKETSSGTFRVNETVCDEMDILVTKVTYPADVKLGALNILKWQLKNEAAASGDKTAMPVQSESISRHSVTYAQDASETDISADFGVPKKYLAFLNLYRKARF